MVREIGADDVRFRASRLDCELTMHLQKQWAREGVLGGVCAALCDLEGIIARWSDGETTHTHKKRAQRKTPTHGQTGTDRETDTWIHI